MINMITNCDKLRKNLIGYSFSYISVVDVVKQPSGKLGLAGSLKEKIKSLISSEG